MHAFYKKKHMLEWNNEYWVIFMVWNIKTFTKYCIFGGKNFREFMALSILVLQVIKSQYKILMQDKIFKVKIFKVIQKSMKSVKISSLEMFWLYSIWIYQYKHILILVVLFRY